MRVDEESRHVVDMRELGGMRFMHKSLRAPRKGEGEGGGGEGGIPVGSAEKGRRFVMPALREDN